MTKEQRAEVEKKFPILEFFAYDHLPPHLQEVSKPFYDIAWISALNNFHSTRPAEVAMGLRKILEAKDCIVRSALPVK